VGLLGEMLGGHLEDRCTAHAPRAQIVAGEALSRRKATRRYQRAVPACAAGDRGTSRMPNPNEQGKPPAVCGSAWASS